MRLQIAYLNYRRLQAFLDADELPHKIGRCVVCLSRASSIEEPQIDRRNLVIQKILSG